MNKDKTIKVGVLARDASGAPDIRVVTVTCAPSAIDNGDHYDMAMSAVEDDGFEPLGAFDETDPAWAKLRAD